MHSIAQIQTQDAMLFYRFDGESPKDVEDMEAILGDLADKGMVCALDFYTEQ